MAETTMEPWSFTIVFDEDKAKKNGYEVDTLYDYVGKNVEGLGNERIARGTWRAAKGYDEVDAQTLAISKLSRQKWVMQNIKSLAFREDDDEIYDGVAHIADALDRQNPRLALGARDSVEELRQLKVSHLGALAFPRPAQHGYVPLHG